MDPLVTETSEFWRNVGEYNDVDTASIKTTVFRLPTSCFAEEDGSIVNSGRWLQWHWKGAEPPGQARPDIAIMPGCSTVCARCTARTAGLPRPDPRPRLVLPQARRTGPDELARESTARP